MIYSYPRTQQVIQGSVFIMSSTFDSNMYSEYLIPCQTRTGVSCISKTHEEIKEGLQNGTMTRQRKQNFANYKEFIKIPYA